jgi:small conductance mechanosensitive channel
VVLSELGMDIGPLLAGAGVVGLAIGFGSQKLVQDVINGVFILFEDSIAVGDVVQVGDHAGVVEALSIRSIRLRDLSGQVHTVPFSAVDTVINMTKDFSYYLLDIGVAYRENTDEVVAVVKDIVEEMREDPNFKDAILEPLDVLGVNAFADSAVVIRARIKTLPSKQWGVGREFNRRMKQRFDERGIEIPFPHTTLYFGEGKDGTAPPMRVRRVDEGGADSGSAGGETLAPPNAKTPAENETRAPTGETWTPPDAGDGGP